MKLKFDPMICYLARSQISCRIPWTIIVQRFKQKFSLFCFFGDILFVNGRGAPKPLFLLQAHTHLCNDMIV